VDEYWTMIHQAAGWAALRAWLLVSLKGSILVYSSLMMVKMFVLNRFLTGSDVVKILRHYQDLTGMDYWHNTEDLSD